LRNKAPACFGLLNLYGKTVYEIQRASLQNKEHFTKVFRSEERRGRMAIAFKKVKI